jgi:hypothetical protein
MGIIGGYMWVSLVDMFWGFFSWVSPVIFGDPQVASRFATWFASSCGGHGPSLAAVRAWHRPAVPAVHVGAAAHAPVPWYGWQPGIPGQLLVVQETGWGAVPEIFKSYLCARELDPKEVEPLGSLVTLQFTSILPQDEVGDFKSVEKGRLNGILVVSYKVVGFLFKFQ